VSGVHIVFYAIERGHWPEVVEAEYIKSAGVAGAGAVGMVSMSGVASANCDFACERRTLGRLDSDEIDSLEKGETSEFTLTPEGDQRVSDNSNCQDDVDVTVQVTPEKFKDGGDEVTCVTIEIEGNNGACGCGDDGLYLDGAKVKGGLKPPNTAAVTCTTRIRPLTS